VLVCGLLLAGCHSSAAPQQVMARRCLPVGGSVPDVTLSVLTPAAGELLVAIEERGVSVEGTLDREDSSAAASPLERLGTIVLVAKTTPGRLHSVQIRGVDSPDIQSEVCVEAQLMSATDRVRVQAERSLAAAGHAVRDHNWETGFEDYTSAARGFDQLGLRRSSAQTRHAMAELAYRRFDRKREAYALAGEALAGYGDVDPIFRGVLAGLRGKALLDMPGSAPREVAPRVRELFSQARQYDEASRFGARELPRLDIMAGFLEYMLDSEAPALARQQFARAAQRCRELQDWDCNALATQNLAQLAEESNNYSVALSDYSDALRSLPPQLDPKLTADIWNNLGRLQGVVGLFSSSERSHEAAMHEYARLGDCPGVRRSLSRSGNLMVQLGSVNDAEDYLQQAAARGCPELLAAAKESVPLGGEIPAVPVTRTGPRYSPGAGAADRKGLCQRTLEAGTLATDNKIIVFNSLLSLSEALSLQSESALARRCLEAAQPYATTARSQMRLSNARGAALLEANDPVQARAAFLQSLRVADEAKLPPTHEHRGIARLGLVKSQLLAGDAAGAVSGGLDALWASVSRGDVDQTVTSLRLAAAGYRSLGRPSDAAHTLQTAADLIEAVPVDELDGEKRATYLATQHAVFADLTDLFASQAATNTEMAWMAFATSERGRARSLRYAVTQATRDAAAPLDAPPAARYREMLREVVSLTGAEAHAASGSLAGAQAQAAPGSLNDPQTSLAQGDLTDALDSAALRERGPAEPLDRERLQGTLRQLDATLVEYSAGSRDMFVFIVSSRVARVVRLGEKREIAGAAAALHDRLRDPEAPPVEVRSAAERLAKLVLWPISDQLAGKRLVFVPDDALHTIPFDVLPWSSGSSDQLVLQHAEVSAVPSALFLTRVVMRPSRADAPRIELIGDPVFRIADWRQQCLDTAAHSAVRLTRAASDWTESLPRLPGSRTEVQMVARLARASRPGSHIETFLGCSAVADTLRRAASERVDLLHVATHARVDAQRPRLSALALTPERGGGSPISGFGLLDILGLKLSSSLVVLSACETSRGRLLPGEGVLGPAQAFLQAGASAVVASYWRVDDQATSRFMQQFYRYLLTEHLSASTALRRAQLDQAADSRSYDWAAFALYGWPDSRI